MRIVAWLLFCFTLTAWAQDPMAYINTFDARVYSLKSKGVKDFVVDLESSRLTKQMNDQMIFGKIDELTFRIFWTASPERLAIEIMGLPEGFKEIKEELKLSIVALMDNLIPQSTTQRFSGYKMTKGPQTKEFSAEDVSGIAAVPSYILKFDQQDRLTEIQGKKPVGTLLITPVYQKEAFSDGKWVLKSITNVTSENGQTMTTKKELSYGLSQGVGVLTKVRILTEQKVEGGKAKPLIFEDTMEFKNYKINNGDGLKYFLSEPVKAPH